MEARGILIVRFLAANAKKRCVRCEKPTFFVTFRKNIAFLPNTFSIRPILLASVLVMLSFSFIKKEAEQTDTATVSIQLTHTFGAEALSFEKKFTNSAGEEFTLSKFKYYLSNFKLIGNSSRPASGESYFLVDEEQPDSKKLIVSFEPGTYTGLRFLLGVDSIRNVSGAQTGALDPLHGMFWTWNTGYIMAKIEGHSPVSRMPGNFFEYHIGGFRGETNTLKQIDLKFPQSLTLQKNRQLKIQVQADLYKWFSGPVDLSIAAKPSITSPGANAKRIADNYADMFTLMDAKTNEP